MSLEFILIYSATVFLASITPGPSMLLALNHGVRYGVRRTMATALGNVSATLIQAALSIAGLGTILLHSETAFNVIRWLGAGYLVMMGIRMFFSSTGGLIDERRKIAGERKSFVGLFTEAFVVTMGNPKAVLFFTALFPQFISTKGNDFVQFFVIVSLLLAITFVCMMTYGFFGHKIAGGLKRRWFIKTCNRVVGGAFVGLGIGLATCKTR